ncbi:hypothetical protein AA0113_g8540 [Alternaria arborescens]|nr:hypothetical protein AA0112_g11776 [Alternaria arborescens]RYO04677.1 hypothetical protein AA0119_g3840 [Alternaria tenuissima]RYO56869.1 hypothetical protein AA0113_g8540 [Alternaria arborescens]
MQGSACFNADMLRRTLLINQSNDGTNGREQAEPPQLRLFPSITPSRLASGAGSRDSNVGEAVHTGRRTNPMPDNWQTLKHRLQSSQFLFSKFKTAASHYFPTNTITMPASVASSVSTIIKPSPAPKCGESCDCCGCDESCWCTVM